MSTSVPPRDGGASAPPPLRTALANEEALRSAFLSEYAALTAEARKDLGPDAAVLSTKVVEGAFVRAWDARGRLQTPDELHKFLVDDVHHAAARALSRRAAAHRLGGAAAHTAHNTTEATPEQSWAHIQSALHGEHSPGALAEAAAISRHEAAEHMVAMTKERPLWAILAVGAAVLVVLIGVVLYIDHLDADNKIARAVNAADSRVVSSIPAQLGTVTLDDGSKVRLAPESKLTIPKTFGPDLRAVKLEGAANFDVAPGQKKDFRVLARDAALVAKGTSFTVRDYPNDPAVTVVVSDGSVELRRNKEKTDLTKGNAYFIPDSGAVRPATPDERVEAEGWRNGTLAITKRPLREVLPQLKRWYGLNVMVQQPPLLERPVTLIASLDSSRQAIRGVEQSTGLEFGYAGQNMVFREPAAKAKAPPKGKAPPKKAGRRR